MSILLRLISPNIEGTSLLMYLSGAMAHFRIEDHELWSIITSNFLHVEWWHFLLNMLALFSLGRIVKIIYDDETLFNVYFVTGLIGSLITLFTMSLASTDYYTLGASGAIFGLGGLLIGRLLKEYFNLVRKLGRFINFSVFSTVNGSTYGVVTPTMIVEILPSLVISLFLGLIPGSGINNLAHFGGLISGLLLGLIMKDTMWDYQSDNYKKFLNVITIICLGITLLCVVLLFLNSVGYVLN